MKPFETPQRGAKIKTSVNFYFNATYRNARGGKVRHDVAIIKGIGLTG